jgi:hypothetical protein
VSPGEEIVIRILFILWSQVQMDLQTGCSGEGWVRAGNAAVSVYNHQLTAAHPKKYRRSREKRSWPRKRSLQVGSLWLTYVIPATQEGRDKEDQGSKPAPGK